MPRRLVLLMFLAAAACGRSWIFDDTAAPPPPVCELAVTPAALDFGTVLPGGSSTLDLSLANQGGAPCKVSGIGLPADLDQDFYLPAGTTQTISLPPGASASIPVTFAPENAAPPLQRSDTLAFETGDPMHPKASVPLKGLVETECRLTIAPTSVDFGTVSLGATSESAIALQNVGSGLCDVVGIALASGSDPEFTLGSGQPASLTLAPGQSGSIGVAFSPTDPAPPHRRTGTLTLQTGDSTKPVASVPLVGNIDVGCELTASPNPLDFGNVILNTTVTDRLALHNQGTRDCHVSAVALGAGSDPEFSLPPSQGTSLTIAVGASASLGVTFVASDSAPPHLKTATLLFGADDRITHSWSIPVQAYVNTACNEASQWIYTVDSNGTFSRFDPSTLTFTDIATLSCPSTSTPFSMAVDQNAVAWVEYQDGNLFQVDTQTGACQATNFAPGQQGFVNFGMGFVFQPTTGLDTLYIAGDTLSGSGNSNLGIVSFPALAVSTVGALALGGLELTGTGDGQLWGFAPAASGQLTAALLQIDPANAATLATYPYPQLAGQGSSWAMKFWGGTFWIFLNQGLYEAPRATPQLLTTAIPNTGRTIVGAGVSTCAPLQ